MIVECVRIKINTYLPSQINTYVRLPVYVYFDVHCTVMVEWVRIHLYRLLYMRIDMHLYLGV